MSLNLLNSSIKGSLNELLESNHFSSWPEWCQLIACVINFYNIVLNLLKLLYILWSIINKLGIFIYIYIYIIIRYLTSFKYWSGNNPQCTNCWFEVDNDFESHYWWYEPVEPNPLCECACAHVHAVPSQEQKGRAEEKKKKGTYYILCSSFFFLYKLMIFSFFFFFFFFNVIRKSQCSFS